MTTIWIIEKYLVQLSKFHKFEVGMGLQFDFYRFRPQRQWELFINSTINLRRLKSIHFKIFFQSLWSFEIKFQIILALEEINVSSLKWCTFFRLLAYFEHRHILSLFRLTISLCLGIPMYLLVWREKIIFISLVSKYLTDIFKDWKYILQDIL